MKLQAKWIWKKQKSYSVYNQTVIAKRTFNCGSLRSAIIKITADSFYRLYVNGQWVTNGPCRSWPEHFQYDQIDIAEYLEVGQNEIKVIARYFGVGTFHNIPQHPGLLVQIEMKTDSGQRLVIISDDKWKVAQAKAWIQNTPKISAQMEPVEIYDARQEIGLRFSKAAILFDTGKGPWKNLNRRDVALLSKEPRQLRSFFGANIVSTAGRHYCLPQVRLVHKNLIEVNRNISCPFGLATVVQLKKPGILKVKSGSFRHDYLKIAVDGRHNPTGRYRLSAGKHFLLGFSRNFFNHDKEIYIHFLEPANLKLVNPLDHSFENPWSFIDFSEFAFAEDDLQLNWFLQSNPSIKEKLDSYNRLTDSFLKKIRNLSAFTVELAGRTKNISREEMFVRDNFWQFVNRSVVTSGAGLIKNPLALSKDNDEYTIVRRPNTSGDIELCYDLGQQVVGYYNFELTAPQGVIIDINGVEYINDNGDVQHTEQNRNGLRYITKEGDNFFTSLKRRSGRYIFVTIRNMKQPVKIRKFEVIESTYPVKHVGNFECADERLNKIWDISARTLKLCMEDVFTDCPLYEQTLWVGDACGESLFAYSTFGATDIARRCIKLAAQSLERYPIVGCQVPSSWDCILPAWSFLWTISVWDYYWYTGDKRFLKEIWKYVVLNLAGAEKHITEHGLFTAPYWNFFDWAKIDQDQKTVLHNSMLFIGAIDAAVKCADVLEDRANVLWLKKLRSSLCKAINRSWDPAKKSYPDSFCEDGTASKSTCVHTSFLSILYDIVRRKDKPFAVKNIVSPPKNMVKVGSPFAILYLYETLDKLGLEDRIMESIYESYIPMLKIGATTVWESFPTGIRANSSFPTRSHCHGWSAVPLYYLNRIILGIKQTAPGCRAFQISPNVNKLKWAKGSVATVKGPVEVSWKIKGRTLSIDCSVPAGVEITFPKNPSLKGLSIEKNISRNGDCLSRGKRDC